MNSAGYMTTLALDVGGTNIRLAVVDASGHIAARGQCTASLACMDARSNKQAQEKVTRILTSAIHDMLKKHAGIQAIGIGFPGFFRADTGVLAASPNIPHLHDFSLAKALSHSLSLPVSVQNDALLAALGEFHFGVGKGLANLLHLTLGTGIGGGLILNGHPYFGENGMSMEIGHVCVVPNGRRCGCGGSGCLEAYASASAVAARYIEATQQEEPTSLYAEDMYRKALDGDIIATNILREAGRYLGQAIADAVKLLDVCNVSLGGGLTGAWKFLSEPLEVGMNENLIPPLKGQIHVQRSILGDDAGLLGAAILGRNPAGDEPLRFI